MKLLAALAISLACSMSSPGNAQGFFTGNEIKRLCDRGNSFCDGYLIGVVDHLLMQQTIIGAKQYFCVPPGTEIGQVLEVIKKHINDDAQNRHWQATTLVYNGFSKAYGCSKK